MIKVGFDFDGVLFYNPTRVLRPIIYFVKKYLLGVRSTKFYIPKKSFTQKCAALLHKTSFGPNKGFDDFIDLVNNPKYEVYIITARPSFLKESLTDLLKPFDLRRINGIIQNGKDEQPHLFKERITKELGLHYYVEDNWDVVKHLSENTTAQIIWMTNIIDTLFIQYGLKARNVKEAVSIIKSS